MSIHTCKLGHIPIGSQFPTVFFAEVGSFFNGDGKKAFDMISKIIETAKSVPDQPVVLKTEILDDPEICLPTDVMETYVDKDGTKREENYRALIERKMMATDDYKPLFKLCRDQNMPFVVSVYDFKAIDFAIEQGAAGLKIASANVTHIPLIRYAASKGVPLVIDTGRTTFEEVSRAINTARKAGCFDIIVQHSPDGHPALPEAHNMRILSSYATAFGIPTGLSDHYTGVEMLYVATTLGASVLEKGVYTDPNELDQDIAHSMGIDDLANVLEKVRDCWQSLGLYERDLNYTIKGNIGASQRQCVVAKCDLKAGDKITLDTVRFAFPRKPGNVEVDHWDLVNGWTLKSDVKAGHPVNWTNVVSSTI